MAQKPGSHLTYEQRCQISAYLKRDISKREISRLLGFSHSTIVREINRNTGQRGYHFKQADNMAQKRRRKTNSAPQKMTPQNINLIKSILFDNQSSPVQT